MTSGELGTLSRCDECGAPLAADQTYCIVCGARSRPLPARVAVALADIEHHGHAIAPDDPSLSDPDPDEDGEPDNVVAAARGGVIALLAVLAVGVVIGGLTSAGGLSGIANTIVLAFTPGVQQAAQVVAPNPGGGGGGAGSGSGGGGGGGGGGAPAAGGGGGGGGATATTPAPVTVTVSESQSTAPGGGGGGGSGGGGSTTPQLPPIGHVWLIVLSQQGYSQSWGDPQANRYLTTLRHQGELVVDYDAVATSPLANEVALLSGQGPTNAMIANCPTYAAISPGDSGKDQQVLGDGCIYPDATQSLPQQITDDGLQWKAYIQGIGEGACPSSSSSGSPTTATATATATGPTPTGPASTSTTPSSTTSTTTSTSGTDCSQTSTTASSTSTAIAPSGSTITTGPASTTSSTTSSSSSTGSAGANAPVDTIGEAACPHPAPNTLSLNQNVSPDGSYVNWKNPIIYFQALLDPGGDCSSNDVGLPQLATDLNNAGATPAFSYIAPDPCNDGSDTPCMPGAKAGIGQAEAFLRQVVPEIEASPDYKQNGLILITSDEAQQSGPNWDTSSCCGQPVFPNLPSPTGSGSSASTTSSSSSTTGAVTTTQTVPSTDTVPSTATGSTTASGTTTSGCETTTSGSSSTTSATAPPGTVPTSTTTTSTAPATTPGSTTSTSTTTATCTPAIAGNPPGGGEVGLLMISPYVQRNKLDTIDTLNHFSLLKSIEALFELPNIGYARDTALEQFGPQMFETTKH